MRAAAPDVSYNSTYIYDIAGNSWTTGPNTNVAHSFTTGAAIGNTLVVVGGYNGTTDTNTVEINPVVSCATPTPCPPSYRVLIVYADSVAPTSLPAALAAEPGIASVTLFDGGTGTPTLGQLQQYEIVVAWSNPGWFDQTTLGNNLGSYLAGGGIVVALNFDWYGGTQSILGTWSTTYSPFTSTRREQLCRRHVGHLHVCAALHRSEQPQRVLSHDDDSGQRGHPGGDLER